MPKALEKTDDGIVIGAGHHGLIHGSYLARAALDILLVDRRLTYSGGAGGSGRCRAIPCFRGSAFVAGQSLNLDGGVTWS